MTHPVIEPGKRVSVVGHTGFGKSWWTRHALDDYEGDMIIYDPEDEYAPGASLDLVKGMEAFERARTEERRAVVVIFTEPKSRQEMQQDVAILAEFAMEQRDVLLVIEEAGETARRFEVPKELWTVARRGRKQGVGLVLISQRITDVDRDLSSQSDAFVVFHLAEHHDQQEAKRRWGPDVAFSIQRIGVGQYYVFPEDARIIDKNSDKLLPSRGELVGPGPSSGSDPDGAPDDKED